MYGFSRPTYSSAVCRNGHVVEIWVVDVSRKVALTPGGSGAFEPIDNFCSKCGAPVLFTCPLCGSPLKDHQPSWGHHVPNDFCGQCGASFPWTTREAMVDHLVDLLNNEGLDPHDRLEAQESLRLLMSPDDSVEIASKNRAADKLKQIATATWLQLAAPVLRTVLTLELQRRLGLPPD